MAFCCEKWREVAKGGEESSEKRNRKLNYEIKVKIIMMCHKKSDLEDDVSSTLYI